VPTLPPEIRTEIPGPRSRELAQRLSRVESRNVTCLVPDPPIFWQRASGANVWDVDDNRFVDLGGGFGVANAGHAHPRIVRAVQEQAGELMHAMGDVHPPAAKVELLEALTARFPGGGPARARSQRDFRRPRISHATATPWTSSASRTRRRSRSAPCSSNRSRAAAASGFRRPDFSRS
jgi:hypothetical protein